MIGFVIVPVAQIPKEDPAAQRANPASQVFYMGKITRSALAGLLLMFLVSVARANSVDPREDIRHSLYIGLTGGYGSTTWGELVPSKQVVAMDTSTPIHATEGGAIWGFFAGYEFSPAFAAEIAYTRYPTADVQFDPLSIFAFEHNGLTEFATHTESFSLSGKLMIQLPNNKFKLFSSVGAAELHRYDVIKNLWRLSPTFGAGLQYFMTKHIFTEIGFIYTAGRGESELDPANDYIPFLYAGFLHLGWQF
ncbi:MAG: outer membrane beta-barrel protein [Gammaproteobacteria bacterium]|nr:outer membrane beta-barrel protein [Gammaproteobacteria bacterium]